MTLESRKESAYLFFTLDDNNLKSEILMRDRERKYVDAVDEVGGQCPFRRSFR